jgi:delta14-sterol reductase
MEADIFVAGFFAPWLLYAGIFVLNRFLPARQVQGYLRDAEGQPICYQLNGLLVLGVVAATYGVGAWLGWWDWAWFYLHRWPMLTGAFVLGLLYSLQLVLPAASTGKPFLADLFLGRTDNQTYLSRVDAKMYLYLVGAIMLFLNTVSFTAYHVQTSTELNAGVIVHACLLTWFVIDYLIFERVHLYTYDIFAERLGFKLAWGCMVFYPFFYVVGLWGTVPLAPPPIIQAFAWPWLTLAALVFFAGWMLARGANMQKYFFKRDPAYRFLNITPEYVSNDQGKLLCNGFWGASRHINYLGEILMATGLALALGHFDILWPWLYPLYYVALLGTRERDDDRRCANKYGPLWDEYRRRVPYRIIPRVY